MSGVDSQTFRSGPVYFIFVYFIYFIIFLLFPPRSVVLPELPASM